jgi:hypothetical protein
LSGIQYNKPEHVHPDENEVVPEEQMFTKVVDRKKDRQQQKSASPNSMAM